MCVVCVPLCVPSNVCFMCSYVMCPSNVLCVPSNVCVFYVFLVIMYVLCVPSNVCFMCS